MNSTVIHFMSGLAIYAWKHGKPTSILNLPPNGNLQATLATIQVIVPHLGDMLCGIHASKALGMHLAKHAQACVGRTRCERQQSR